MKEKIESDKFHTSYHAYCDMATEPTPISSCVLFTLCHVTPLSLIFFPFYLLKLPPTPLYN